MQYIKNGPKCIKWNCLIYGVEIKIFYFLNFNGTYVKIIIKPQPLFIAKTSK